MATKKYASTAALQALATKVKGLLAGKVNAVEGKGLSTNDLTAELLAHLNAGYDHSQVAHAPANAQANLIEKIKVNGTELEIGAAKDVEITTLTDADLNTKLAPYAKTADVSTAIAEAVAAAPHLKRSVVAALPELADADAMTIYMVKKADGAVGNTTGNVYTEYMVLEGKWEIVGDTTVDLTAYAKTADVTTAINTAVANLVSTDALNTALAAYVKAEDLVEITAAEVEAMFA